MSERERAPIPRSVALGIGAGLAAALSAFGLAYAILAVPAQLDRDGIDRPSFRDSLFHVALPIAVALGIAVAALIALWHRRGGHLPTDRSPF